MNINDYTPFFIDNYNDSHQLYLNLLNTHKTT